MKEVSDIIFEKYSEGKLDHEHTLLLLEASEDRDKVKKIKEKIKKKEPLTNEETNFLKEYKKKRNKKIAIGVGIGAAAVGATAMKIHNELKREDEKLKRSFERWEKEHEENMKRINERERERERERNRERKMRHDFNENPDIKRRLNEIEEERKKMDKDWEINSKLVKHLEKEINRLSYEYDKQQGKIDYSGFIATGTKDDIYKKKDELSNKIRKLKNTYKKYDRILDDMGRKYLKLEREEENLWENFEKNYK